MRARRADAAPIAWLSLALALLLLLALAPPALALDAPWAPAISDDDDADGFSLDDTPAGTPLVGAWQAPPPSFAPLPDAEPPARERSAPRSAPSRGPPPA